MENEILQQILEKLDTIGTKVDKLEQGQAELQQGQTELKQDVTKIKVKLENETNRNINLLVEGHAGIVENIKELKSLNERVLALQDKSHIHEIAISELSRKTASK